MNIKKEVTIEHLKTIGVADFYGNIDESKYEKYLKEQKEEGYNIVIQDASADKHNFLDNEPIVYNGKVIQRNVTII